MTVHGLVICAQQETDENIDAAIADSIEQVIHGSEIGDPGAIETAIEGATAGLSISNPLSLKSLVTRTITAEVHPKPYSLGRIFPSVVEAPQPTIEMVRKKNKNLVVEVGGVNSDEETAPADPSPIIARTPLTLTDEQKESSKKELTKVKTQAKLSFGGKTAAASSLQLKAEKSPANEVNGKASKKRKKSVSESKEDGIQEDDQASREAEKENVRRRKSQKEKQTEKKNPTKCRGKPRKSQMDQDEDADVKPPVDSDSQAAITSASSDEGVSATAVDASSMADVKNSVFVLKSRRSKATLKFEDVEATAVENEPPEDKGRKRRTSNEKSVQKSRVKRRRVGSEQGGDQAEVDGSMGEEMETESPETGPEADEDDDDDGVAGDSLIGKMQRRMNVKRQPSTGDPASGHNQRQEGEQDTGDDDEVVVFVPVVGDLSANDASDSDVFFTANEDNDQTIHEEKEKGLEEKDMSEKEDEEERMDTDKADNKMKEWVTVRRQRESASAREL